MVAAGLLGLVSFTAPYYENDSGWTFLHVLKASNLGLLASGPFVLVVAAVLACGAAQLFTAWGRDRGRLARLTWVAVAAAVAAGVPVLYATAYFAGFLRQIGYWLVPVAWVATVAAAVTNALLARAAQR